MLLIAIIPLVFFILSLDGDVFRRESFRTAEKQGGTLKISELAEGECILIDQIEPFDWGEAEGHTYVIIGGAEKTIASIGRTVLWKKGWGPVLTDSGRVRVYTLDSLRQQGLDVFLQYLRKPKDFWWQYPDTYEISYFRDGREIGSEKLVDVFHLNIPDRKEPYQDIEPFYRSLFSPDDWDAVVTFRQLLIDLEKEEEELADATDNSAAEISR